MYSQAGFLLLTWFVDLVGLRILSQCALELASVFRSFFVVGLGSFRFYFEGRRRRRRRQICSFRAFYIGRGVVGMLGYGSIFGLQLGIGFSRVGLMS